MLDLCNTVGLLDTNSASMFLKPHFQTSHTPINITMSCEYNIVLPHVCAGRSGNDATFPYTNTCLYACMNLTSLHLCYTNRYNNMHVYCNILVTFITYKRVV